MKRIVSYDQDNKCVLISIADGVNPEDLFRVCEEAIRVSKSYRTEQFLFDLLILAGSEASLDNAIQSIPEILHMLGLSSGSKIAFVTRQHIPSPENTQLWEKQQREHGYKVQVFPSPEYGIEWLRPSLKQISL